MASGTSGGHLLLMAFICQGLGCCHTQDNSSASPHNQGSISINTVTYPVIDGGCCPLISRIGSGILDSLADTPADATLLEMTSFSPNYDTIRNYTASNQGTISSFITYLWVVFGVFIVVIVVIFLMRLIQRCGARREQRVTKNYMLAFLFYFISLTVLLALCIVFLVWLIFTSAVMRVALEEWAPDLYNRTFINLKLFVNLTVHQIAESRLSASQNVSRVLGPDFDRAFQKFIADSVMEDLRVPLYHMARDCATDHRYLGRVLNAEGQVRLGVTFEKIGDQCAQIHRDHEELFGKVADAVAHITAPNRLQLLEVLTDSMSTLDASDVDVKPSYTTIDMLQMKLQGFEEHHGVHKYLKEKVIVWLFFLMVLFIATLALLVLCLLMGIVVHRRYVRPHKRSRVSHFVGVMLIVTAYAFSAFAILAILTVIYLTAYNTLGYCYFCGPYLIKNYTILDDATDRMWPVSNRSQLLSKIIPSEVVSKCQDESVSIFDLGPVSSHRRTVHHQDFDVSRVSLQAVLQKLAPRAPRNNSKNPLFSHEDTFRRLLSSLKNVTSTDNRYLRDVRRISRGIYDKWHTFWAERDMLGFSRASIEQVLVPMVPLYLKRFVKRATQDLITPVVSKPTVIGPCFIIHNIITSIMDVTCKGFVIQLVSYWATLLFSIVSVILIIIACFLFSKYFLRTQQHRKTILRKLPRRKRRLSSFSEATESTEITEFSEPSWPSSLVTRSIFAHTTSRTSVIPLHMLNSHISPVTSLQTHSPIPFRSSSVPMVGQTSTSCFASVPAIMHYHPFVDLTSQTSMHHAISSEASFHVSSHRISAPTAVRSAKHSHALKNAVTPVRYAYSSTTVRTPLCPPPPLRVMTATPAPLPMAPAMTPPPVITQPLMPSQASEVHASQALS